MSNTAPAYNRNGYATIIENGDTQYIIFASTEKRLKDAFFHATGGFATYDEQATNYVKITGNTRPNP